MKEEPGRMLEAGIIVEVTEPTDLCAPMIPDLKHNGKVRICVDLRKLINLSVRKRTHDTQILLCLTPDDFTREPLGY